MTAEERAVQRQIRRDEAFCIKMAEVQNFKIKFSLEIIFIK